MKSLKERIEISFEQLTLWVFGHPWRVLAGLLLLVAFLVIQLPQLTFDVTIEGQFQRDDPSHQNYIEFKQQYGDDTAILIGIQSQNIFTQPFLQKLQQLHNELENETPYLDKITSLINVNSIRSEGEQLIVQDLMEEWPQTEQELQQFKEYVLNYPAYQNILISEDGTYTAIYLIPDVRALEGETDFLADEDEAAAPLEEQPSLLSKILSLFVINEKSDPEKLITAKMTLTNAQRVEMVETVKGITERYNSEDFSIFLTGNPVILKDHLALVERTLPKTILGTTLGILIIMFLIFRRFVPVLLTILVVILSLVSVFSFMSIFNIPVRTSTQVFPPIILAAGICDAIHLFTIFFQWYKQKSAKKSVLASVMRHSGLAMLFTSLTTMGGFLAFSLSDLAGIAELGVSAAVGVFMALFYTYLLIPAMLALLPMSPKQRTTGSLMSLQEGFWEKGIKRLALFSTRQPVMILGIAAVIAIIAVIGATQIQMSFNILTWFPKSSPIEADAYRADDAFKGVSALEIVIDTGQENGLFDPEIMNRIEQAQEFAEGFTTEKVWVGKTMSIVDTLKQINKVLNENRNEFYTIPQDRTAIAQELLLFEMGGWEDLEDIVDGLFSQARLTLKVPWLNGIDFVPFREEIEQEFVRIFEDQADIYLTGAVDLTVRSVWGLINSFTSSYLLAGTTITLLLILLTGSLRIGLVGMIPNFFPILVVLGLMGFWGLPITAFTVLLGGIALGLAVDDTVHFLHNFRRNFHQTRNVLASVTETIQTTGRALFFTTVSIGLGFFVFLSADMCVLRTFGVLTGLTIIIALLADLTITPALMTLMYHSQKQQVPQPGALVESSTY